jgi:hypothetical protein
MLRRLSIEQTSVHSASLPASLSSGRQSSPSQFSLLLWHLLDRFFNNEMLSVGGETLPLIMTVAGAIAVPTLIAAIFAFPAYHAFPPRPPIPPYWDRAAEHLFFVMYSFVAMGVITVFEADLLFPNLLDLLILSPLPIPHSKLILARVSATLLFLVLFLLGINSLGIIAYPPVTEFQVGKLFIAHLAAVLMAGTFTAAVFLAVQGALICILGSRAYQVASTILQGVAIAVLLTVLLSFALIYPLLGQLIQSTSTASQYYPPFWFLGIYECILNGPSRMPAFVSLARIGYWATVASILIATFTYPLAYLKRTRQAIEGTRPHGVSRAMSGPITRILHATILRAPSQRAVYHFLSQTIRTPRHRVYLAMYAGLGVALLISDILRLHIDHGRLGVFLSPSGLRAAVPGVAFWTVSGLCSALASPADPRGGWIFRVIDGCATQTQLHAVSMWVAIRGVIITVGVVALLHLLTPLPLRLTNDIATQLLVGVGICVLLTDVLLLDSRTIPFTEARIPQNTDLAFILVRYIAIFPAIVMIAVRCEPWIGSSSIHLATVAIAIALTHEIFLRAKQNLLQIQAKRTGLNESDGIIQTLNLR